jgi:hypothetical protein
MQNLLLICSVCGDKGTGLHYGAITCEACKVILKLNCFFEIKFNWYLNFWLKMKKK